MEKRQDILLDENNDLLFENGDLVIGESDTQHVKDIFDAQPGSFKEFPRIGFGAINYIKSNTSPRKFTRNLKEQLNRDGYTNPTVDLSEGYKQLKIKV